jgi:uncharacterized membrane protein YdfJ with MMPL/SSD domain
MDLLSKIASSLETAIRYLLTGTIVSLATLLARTDGNGFMAWVAMNIPLTIVVVAISGFASFTFYRLCLWTFGDAVAWYFGLSAPTKYVKNGCSYSAPYAKFLIWRHSSALSPSLSGYLTYRWSVAHFSVVAGLTLLLACFFKQVDSWVAAHAVVVALTGTASTVLGAWQIAFLYRVERDLCEPKEHA